MVFDDGRVFFQDFFGFCHGSAKSAILPIIIFSTEAGGNVAFLLLHTHTKKEKNQGEIEAKAAVSGLGKNGLFSQEKLRS